MFTAVWANSLRPFVSFKVFYMDFIQKRFEELALRAQNRYYTTFTDFLNMEEQSELVSMRLGTPFKLFGGYDGAERCVAAFGADCENAEFPISYIQIEPLAKKFADTLTHRDFLGSLMGLGIKRETLGDILIKDNVGYLMCLDSVADFVADNLGKVRHTSVKCTAISELPQGMQSEPQEQQKIVASLRLDVLAAAVYDLSRSAVKELFTQRKVFVNSRLCENFSLVPKEGDIISVRGKGRFKLGETLGSTKKGRLIVQLFVYK